MVHNNTFTVAEVELTYTPTDKIANRPQITSPQQAYDIFLQHWNPGKIEFVEEFKILLLNRRSRVLGIVDISLGGIAATVADAKVIFVAALKACASYIILCHNHPSGELNPSDEDIALTKKLKAGALMLDLKIYDHLIISNEGFYSFEEGG